MEMNRVTLSVILFFAGLCVFFCPVAWAQLTEDVSFSGTIKNKQTGASLPGATISLEGYSLTTNTDANGKFLLTGQSTGVKHVQSHLQDLKAYSNGRGIVLNVPPKAKLKICLYTLDGKVAANFTNENLSKGQWVFTPQLTPGFYVCQADINGQSTIFKYHQAGKSIFISTTNTNYDKYENPLAMAKGLASSYTLSVSKSRFMTNRVALSGANQQDITVLLDTIKFVDGMTEQQVRDALCNLTGTDSVIFIKRFTLNSNHYYTEHINSDWKPGGNLCILNLKTGSVSKILTDPKFSNGIIKRFDLSYDAKKVVFDFKSSVLTGYRIYEADIATGTVRQITTPQANEDSLVNVYKCSNTQCGDAGRGLSCNVQYHHGTDDMEPCYLPDGGIVFVSTRCQIGTPCDAPDNFTTTNMYRVDIDGKNMRPLSRSMASEFTPTIMPNGRILYSRWEYVDKASAAAKCLWSMYPNGAGSAEVYKNDINVPPTFVQARVIPGTLNKFVTLATPHCCYNGQYGTVIKLDMDKNIRTRDPIEYITKEVDAPDHTVLSWPLSWGKYNTYRDPYPLAEDLYLVSFKPGSISQNWWEPKGYGLYVLTSDNKQYQFYRDTAISSFEVMPFKSRPKEPLVTIPLDPDLASKGQAKCTVNDIYYNMENVPRGSIKYIRIMEQVPRTWAAHHWWGYDDYGLAHAAVERNAALGLKVQWGIVPVESDGSANFYVPSGRAIFFHALDSNFQVVQHERTYVNYMPGETRSCTGCHETPDKATPVMPSIPLALRRDPSVPGPQPGDTTGKIVLDYENRVQPIWDKYCTKCHNPTDKKGNLDLSGTRSGIFSVSYDQLMDRRNWLLGFYIDEEPRNPVETAKYLPAYSMFSNCILLKMLGVPVTLRDIPGAPTYLEKWASQRGTQADMLTNNHKTRFTLTREELIKVSNWIQTNLQYRGSYWGRFNTRFQGHPNFRPRVTFEQAIGTVQPVSDH
jgi:Tol biopolymer transport system component